MAIALFGLNVFYVPCLLLLSVFYGLAVLVLAPLYCLIRGRRIDEAMRFSNQLYGALLVRTCWPLVRVRRRGFANVPRSGPCAIVVNHRSFTDVMFCGLIPVPQIVVVVRSWPFRIWLLSWFMRMANYIDIERTHLDRPLAGLGGGLVARGCSFLFFPEGHRSRNGRLQRFRSGAFWVAAEHGLPIVPICLSGTERITAGRWPLLHPALVTMEALPPVHPSSFPPDNRALLMKREVENVFRKYFGE